MRHSFTDHYRADDAGTLVRRTRCAWCGMGSSWPGASEQCSGSVPDMVRRPEQRRTEARARAKLISQHRAEVRYQERARKVGS